MSEYKRPDILNARDTCQIVHFWESSIFSWRRFWLMIVFSYNWNVSSFILPSPYRSQADQSAVLPTQEELAEKSHQLAEKPPPHCRPLRRTHTDPTDLLWVFRRRATRLAQEGNNNLGIPRRKLGVSALFHPPIDGTYEEIPESTGEGVNEKVWPNTTS